MKAVRQGIRVVDAGGGSLYAAIREAEKAKGNVATEVMVAALEEKGYKTNVDK